MADLLKLFLAVLASLFKSRAWLEAENLVLRQQGQCASATDAQADCSEKHRSPSVCLALSLFPLNRRHSCDCQAGDSHSLAPDRLPRLLALAIAQSHWQTESGSRVAVSHWRDEPSEP